MTPETEIILTVVCSECHAGWEGTVSDELDSCPMCGSELEVRGLHVAVPL